MDTESLQLASGEQESQVVADLIDKNVGAVEAAGQVGQAVDVDLLLGLGSMMSTGAFADYVPLTCVWLLTLLVVKVVDQPRVAVGLGLCAVLQFFILGTVPMGNWTPIGLMLPLSALGTLAMMAAFGWTLAEVLLGRRVAGAAATIPAPTGSLWQSRLEPVRIPVPTRPHQRKGR
jgi:hypothetical protein